MAEKKWYVIATGTDEHRFTVSTRSLALDMARDAASQGYTVEVRAEFADKPSAVLEPTGDMSDDPELWLALVRRQIGRVGPLAAREREEDVARAAATLAEAADLAVAAGAAADAAERARLLERRRTLLEGLIELYATRAHAAEAVTQARQLLDSP